LAGVIDLFAYLRYGLGAVLGFVGIKMLLVDIYKIPIGISLAVVAGILTCSIVASLLVSPAKPGSDGLRFSFTGWSGGSNKFRIWFAIVGAVLAVVVFVQAAFPL